MSTWIDRTPTFTDFFKSFYYKNTYLPPIDLNEKWIEKHALKGDVADKIQEMMSSPEIEEILLAPLSYNSRQVIENNRFFDYLGFTLLAEKNTGKKDVSGKSIMMPYYSVIEHPQVEGWVIKLGSKRIAKGDLVKGAANDLNEMVFNHEDDSLLRIEMAQRITQIAREANINDDVLIPEKKLVCFKENSGSVVLCKKIPGLSRENTLVYLSELDSTKQKELARKISDLVEKAGLADANFDNIFITHDNKIAFIDTEPSGLMTVKKPGLWKRLFGYEQASIEKCARIGLYTLMIQTENVEEIVAFHEEFKERYEKVRKPKLSKTKILFACLSLGLIPLTQVLIALVKMCLAKICFYLLKNKDKLNKMIMSLNKPMMSLIDKVPCVS